MAYASIIYMMISSFAIGLSNLTTVNVASRSTFSTSCLVTVNSDSSSFYVEYAPSVHMNEGSGNLQHISGVSDLTTCYNACDADPTYKGYNYQNFPNPNVCNLRTVVRIERWLIIILQRIEIKSQSVLLSKKTCIPQFVMAVSEFCTSYIHRMPYDGTHYEQCMCFDDPYSRSQCGSDEYYCMYSSPRETGYPDLTSGSHTVKYNLWNMETDTLATSGVGKKCTTYIIHQKFVNTINQCQDWCKNTFICNYISVFRKTVNFQSMYCTMKKHANLLQLTPKVCIQKSNSYSTMEVKKVSFMWTEIIIRFVSVHLHKFS